MKWRHSKAKEKNKVRTDISAYFVESGLPLKWEIESIPAKADSQGSV